MAVLMSLRDVWLVARFELLRNLRTWRALALCLLFTLVMGGGAYLFTRFIWTLESNVAEVLKVPQTETPGAMMQQLIAEDRLRKPLGEMIGDESLVDHILSWPILAFFHMWAGMVLVPFLAAAAAAESIVLDTASRAIRFECLRTGRTELVLGRFLGQLLLVFAASLLSIGATWIVGMVYMVGNDPLTLFLYLLRVTPTLWVVALPYIGIGLAASQATESANMARVVALVLSVLSFIVPKYAERRLEDGGNVLWDVVLQVSPLTYYDELWRPGAGWLTGAAALFLMGLAFLGAGLPVFTRRDL